jgi:hypothetical protein
MSRKTADKPHPTPDPEKSHILGRSEWSGLAGGIPGFDDTTDRNPGDSGDPNSDGPNHDSCFDDLDVVLSESMQQPDPDPNLGTAEEGLQQQAGREAVPALSRRGRTPTTSEIFRTVVAGGRDPSVSTGSSLTAGAERAPAEEIAVADVGLLDRPGESGRPETQHSEGSIPWGQILLLSYSSALTLALTWMLWTGRVPKAAVPADPPDPPPVGSARKPANAAPDAEAPPLPPENITTIGKALRLGDVEVTPMAVEAVPLELIGTVDPDRLRREDDCLILRLRLVNHSRDRSFTPVDRILVRDRDLRVFDPYITTSEGRRIRLFPLALDSEWSILGQSFPVLEPGESAETFIAAEPGSAAHPPDEMTWRVRLWTGVYRSDMLGVKFTRQDVQRPRTISRDGPE